ncbi:hypothetical protein L211DRAFT_832865 [Terfezia boudieri ATCC MYA-4762]|uniref:Uncharacterized protein n=1 Tax=Terfezia boudieri ATCC MYA-4762 TaxID=1051890 RepID=A0A3N4M1D8_9PEZI|nr:hypothetical protein L211DRAFT_832865 [Terfezia boudieri ATCC MYA-4762]
MSNDKLKHPERAYKAPNEPLTPRTSSESSKTPFELQKLKVHVRARSSKTPLPWVKDPNERCER